MSDTGIEKEATNLLALLDKAAKIEARVTTAEKNIEYHRREYFSAVNRRDEYKKDLVPVLEAIMEIGLNYTAKRMQELEHEQEETKLQKIALFDEGLHLEEIERRKMVLFDESRKGRTKCSRIALFDEGLSSEEEK